MNIKINAFFLMFFLLIYPACAGVFEHQENLESIAPKLPELKNIKCKFYQEKFIQSSNIRLKSSGDFVFEKNKGVTFYTTYPYKSTVSYTQSEYKQINKIIKAIADKNYSKLENEFKFYFEQNDEIWELGFKPKDSSKASNYIESIKISGKDKILKIIIKTTDKVDTEINFK